MGSVTIHSDFGVQEKKSVTVSTFPFFFAQKVMGLDAMILVYWMLRFKPSFSLSSFTSSRGCLVPLHFCHKDGIICISEVIDIFLGSLDSHASKLMLKILQARLQQYVNQELPDVQAGFRKGRGTRDQIVNTCWIIEKAREFQKKISASLTMLKPLAMWITTNCVK